MNHSEIEACVIQAKNGSKVELLKHNMTLVIMVYFNGVSLRTYVQKKGMDYQQAIRKGNRILVKLSHYIKR